MKLIPVYATFALLVKFLILNVPDLNSAIVFLALVSLSIAFLFFYNREEYSSLKKKLEDYDKRLSDLSLKAAGLESAANAVKFSKEMGAQIRGR